MGQLPDSHESEAIELDDQSLSPLCPSTTPRRSVNGLPPFDRALRTRNICVAGIAISYILSVVCIGLPIYTYVRSANFARELRKYYGFDYLYTSWCLGVVLDPGSRTVVDLVLNAAVTICTEALGYVHTASLRWALWREGRLHYNSNLRLLTQAGDSIPNSWYANIIFSIALIVTYAGASQVFIAIDGSEDFVQVNGVAILFLGIGLLVQAVISHICLSQQSTRIPTWSSNVLTVTLACLHQKSSLHHRDGRCILSTRDNMNNLDQPTQPRLSQPSLRATDASTRHLTHFIWFLPAATLIWGTVVVIVERVFITDRGS